MRVLMVTLSPAQVARSSSAKLGSPGRGISRIFSLSQELVLACSAVLAGVLIARNAAARRPASRYVRSIRAPSRVGAEHLTRPMWLLFGAAAAIR
jgi:hypothetical protein